MYFFLLYDIDWSKKVKWNSFTSKSTIKIPKEMKMISHWISLFSTIYSKPNEKLKAIEIQYNYYLCRTLILIIKILNRQRSYSRCWNEKYNFNSISFINIKNSFYKYFYSINLQFYYILRLYHFLLYINYYCKAQVLNTVLWL